MAYSDSNTFAISYGYIYYSGDLIPGVDVTANQEEISDHETFQLEYDPTVQRWYLRTMQDKYFTLGAGGGIQANETKRYVDIREQQPVADFRTIKHREIF